MTCLSVCTSMACDPDSYPHSVRDSPLSMSSPSLRILVRLATMPLSPIVGQWGPHPLLSLPPLSHLSHAPRAFVSSAIFSGPLVRVVARCMVRVYMSWPICLLLSFLSYVYLSILTLNCNLTTMSSRLPTSSLLPTLSYVAFLYQYQSTGKRCPSITSRP